MKSFVGGIVRAVIGVVIAFAIVMLVSLELPDELEGVFNLQHRSGLTHGILAPAIVYAVAVADDQAIIRRFISIGVSLGVAIHLSFDLFPHSWQGYALITVPIFGRLSKTFSWLWIAFGIALTLALVVMAVASLQGTVVRLIGTLFSILGGIFFFMVYAADQDAFWGPAIAFVGSAILALGSLATQDFTARTKDTSA